MRNTFLPLSLISVLLLSGCAIGPDYQNPSHETPESFRFTDSNATTVMINEWWKDFNDPKMEGYIQEALRHNHDIQSSQASVELLLGQFEQIKSAIFPQINASASLNRKDVNNASRSFMLREGVTSTYAASLSLASYEIDIFGKIRRANEAARAQLLSSQYTKDAMSLSISANVALSYLTLASLNEQLSLAKQNVHFSQEILDLTRLRYQHGTISKTVLLQSESEWNNANANHMTLKSAKIAEEGKFNTLLGRNPVSIETAPINTIVLPDVPDALPSELLKRRPDIASAEQNLIASNAQIGVAKAAYFPSIKLTGLFGVQSLELDNFVSNPSRIFELTPSVSIPLFSGGRIEGEVNAANAGYKKSLAEYQKSLINALNDTDSALGMMAYSKEQLRFQNERARIIFEALEQSKMQYKFGTIDYGQLLQVQQQWLSARQNQITARQNALAAAVNLRKSLGGGWEKDQTLSSY